VALRQAARETISTRLKVDRGLDAALTLRALWMGPGDPQVRISGATVVRATRTDAGPAALRLTCAAGEIIVQAWGPGADSAVGQLPELLGAGDDPSALIPRHRLVRDLQRRLPGLRLTRTGAVVEALVPAVVSQKVTGLEAKRAYRALLRRFGEAAPGPLGDLGLRVPPEPAVLAGQAYAVFHPIGLERRRAETIIAVARAARQLEEARGMRPPEARRRLQAVPGVGPWTAAEAARVALGDPDAVSVGDYNLPHLVSWALSGRPRGSDEEMLELLEPYRGQRARVVRLLELSGIRPPRYGPRQAPRNIAAM
jgi:3-methyladenine DNA glycosylase/8-oxoguanine DNA glycosylase